MNQWVIMDNVDQYPEGAGGRTNGKLKKRFGWPTRKEGVIDKIIVSATDSTAWDAENLYGFDISEDNDITPGKPLGGISCHIFINSNGTIEKVTEYDSMTLHTPGINMRSINITIQYLITDNLSEPNAKIQKSLQEILAILCLQFKLNPHKAIRGQSEVWYARIPFLKGRRKNISTSPGVLLNLDAIRNKVALDLQKKLMYVDQDYDGPITKRLNRKAKKALNRFISNHMKNLYQDYTPKNLRGEL